MDHISYWAHLLLRANERSSHDRVPGPPAHVIERDSGMPLTLAIWGRVLEYNGERAAILWIANFWPYHLPNARALTTPDLYTLIRRGRQI